MAFPELQPGQSRMCTIEQLLEHEFHIPAFQRPYDWEGNQVQDMIGDLAESQKKGSALFLGLVVVCPSGDNRYAIVDGQQRLTTLMLAIASRGGRSAVLRCADGGLSAPWISPRANDTGFVRALLAKAKENPTTLSQRRLKEALGCLCEETGFMLATVLRAQVIVYVAPTLAGATGLFERINLRGKDVSQFDLVKNKLIEWSGAVGRRADEEALAAFITERYDHLYRLLDPSSTSNAYDSDKLLKVHWILFSEKTFKTGERVLARLDATLNDLHASACNIAIWIETYLDSLVEVAEVWVAVERPYELKPNVAPGKKLRDALLGFARLGRETELQPLIVAAIVRWGEQAADLVRFCEITSFRSALAKHNASAGRSQKWRFARQLYQGTWSDGIGARITTAAAAVHQLFWATTPWWNQEEAAALGERMSTEELNTVILPENALDSPKFYGEHRELAHYFFWNYGIALTRSGDWAAHVREDINPFQECVWFGKEDSFQQWDIEHLYPQTPADRMSKEGTAQLKLMAAWMHHLGNLTVLPIRDNRKMQNAAFDDKLDWLRQQKKVSFNELLASPEYRGNLMNRPHWGPNNCKKRVARMKEAAAEIWGTKAIKRLGVGKYDARLDDYLPAEDENTLAQ